MHACSEGTRASCRIFKTRRRRRTYRMGRVMAKRRVVVYEYASRCVAGVRLCLAPPSRAGHCSGQVSDGGGIAPVTYLACFLTSQYGLLTVPLPDLLEVIMVVAWAGIRVAAFATPWPVSRERSTAPPSPADDWPPRYKLLSNHYHLDHHRCEYVVRR
nr:hypothetical protein CFP56_07830 [Quercus suber]